MLSFRSGLAQTFHSLYASLLTKADVQKPFVVETSDWNAREVDGWRVGGRVGGRSGFVWECFKYTPW